jgi:hypothetical protein
MKIWTTYCHFSIDHLIPPRLMLSFSWSQSLHLHDLDSLSEVLTPYQYWRLYPLSINSNHSLRRLGETSDRDLSCSFPRSRHLRRFRPHPLHLTSVPGDVLDRFQINHSHNLAVGTRWCRHLIFSLASMVVVTKLLLYELSYDFSSFIQSFNFHIRHPIDSYSLNHPKLSSLYCESSSCWQF